MASVQYLFSLTQDIPDELTKTQEVLAKLTDFRNLAATIIQKNWRRYIARKKYLYTLKCIITIQAYYRGWAVRRRRKQYEEQHELDLDWLIRDKAARKIQAWWRGILARKEMARKGLLPKDRLRERARIAEISKQMQDYFREQYAHHADQEIEDMKKMILFMAFKNHHLLRTYAQEGIHSIHNSKELSLIEKLLKCVNMTDYMNELRKVYKTNMEIEEQKEPYYYFADKKLQKFEKLYRLRDRSKETKPMKDDTFESIQKPPFDVSRRCKGKYERKMLLEGVYVRPIDFITRDDEIKAKNVSKTDFKLDPTMDLKEKALPYYIDFWEKIICEIHNPPEI